MKIKIGDKVETTKEFEEKSGFRIVGRIKSQNPECVCIINYDDVCLCVPRKGVQKVEDNE
ncbi:hypothetical protein KAU33_09265 [Candidatus Dependentiae bacterium]|nr:hypothetical protein [Candidatus Dependentiae bacterium]